VGIKLTAVGAGYYRVYKDGAEISRHTNEREAVEAASNLELANPGVVVTYKHDYEVKVEATGTVPIPVPIPTPGVRTLFAASSFYNAKLADNVAIHANSANMVKELIRQSKPQNTDSTQPKFNSLVPVYDTPTYDPAIMYYGTVNAGSFTSSLYIVTDPNLAKVPIRIWQNNAPADWMASVYDRLMAGIRLPAGAAPNPGTDGHIAIWDQVDDVLVELWQFRNEGGEWRASFGGIITDVSNANGVFPSFTNKWGSVSEQGATATSLTLAGGMIKEKELAAGVIGHCIGFAIPEGPNKFVWPARRTDGVGNQFWEGPNALPAGTRFRFPKDIAIDPNWIPLVKMMVEAIRDYGCVVQDRAGAICFYAENATHRGIADVTVNYRKKVDGTVLQGWQFMNPSYFPFAKLQVLA
jgi:hypothetical protein